MDLWLLKAVEVKHFISLTHLFQEGDGGVQAGRSNSYPALVVYMCGENVEGMLSYLKLLRDSKCRRHWLPSVCSEH